LTARQTIFFTGPHNNNQHLKMASIDFKSLYCYLNERYQEMDFDRKNDEVTIDLDEDFKCPQDESLNDTYHEFVTLIEELWSETELNATHQVGVNYWESDHTITITIERVSWPTTCIGWSESEELKAFMDKHPFEEKKESE